MKRNLAVLGLAAALIATPAALAGGRNDHHSHQLAKPKTIAVIGDTPYGDGQIADFPADVAEINADRKVRRVIHLGDIKNGSSRCDTSYYKARRADFDAFEDPFHFTPGDNEWTDCHRANNGAYLPTERLAALRHIFFPRPGKTLGQHRARVEFQSHKYPENTRWSAGGVTFGLVHVVGSNDNQLPWFGTRESGPETPAETALRSREYVAREAAALRWIDGIFDEAEDNDAPAVVIGMQADMWDGPPENQTAFAPIKAVIADRAATVGKPVLLLQGDSHEFVLDTPPGMPANLTRVVVQGAESVPHEWLRLRIDASDPNVFSCERVEFVTKTVTACPEPLTA